MSSPLSPHFSSSPLHRIPSVEGEAGTGSMTVAATEQAFNEVFLPPSTSAPNNQGDTNSSIDSRPAVSPVMPETITPTTTPTTTTTTTTTTATNTTTEPVWPKGTEDLDLKTLVGSGDINRLTPAEQNEMLNLYKSLALDIDKRMDDHMNNNQATPFDHGYKAYKAMNEAQYRRLGELTFKCNVSKERFETFKGDLKGKHWDNLKYRTYRSWQVVIRVVYPLHESLGMITRRIAQTKLDTMCEKHLKDLKNGPKAKTVEKLQNFYGDINNKSLRDNIRFLAVKIIGNTSEDFDNKDKVQGAILRSLNATEPKSEKMGRLATDVARTLLNTVSIIIIVASLPVSFLAIIVILSLRFTVTLPITIVALYNKDDAYWYEITDFNYTSLKEDIQALFTPTKKFANG